MMKTYIYLLFSLMIVGCGSTSNTASTASQPIDGSNSLAIDQYGRQDYQYGRPENTQANAPLVSLDSISGQLFYRLYANQGQVGKVNMVPDFSYAGYGGGGVPLPAYGELPIKIELHPGQQDQQRIQQAINYVANLPPNNKGIRGVILLKAGKYILDGPLVINTGGIILRGEGQGLGGTLLQANSREHRDKFIVIEGEGNGEVPKRAVQVQRRPIAQPFVPVGSNRIELTSTRGYSVGDTIGILRTPDWNWLGEFGINTGRFNWRPVEYEQVYERTVTAIDGNWITFDVPMVDTIEQGYGGGEVYRLNLSGRIQQVGIENLRLETLKYNLTNSEDRAFYGINLSEVENSWIRDVTLRYFSHGITFHDGTRFNTVQDVAYLDPDFEVNAGRNYGFVIDGGSLNFFQRCYARGARSAFITGSKTTGPNVFLDCLSEKDQNDSGPHHRWAVGTLFDNLAGNRLRAQNRMDSGSGHGWAGAQQMFWNNKFNDYVLQAPQGAMNWAVGNEGGLVQIGQWAPKEPNGIIESHGNKVEPRSLYLQQLKDRLGSQAVEAIATPDQLKGDIWLKLEFWKGEGALSAQ